MKFEKTGGDIQMLRQNSYSRVGWVEALDLMLDITLDIQTDTGSNLSQLEVTDEAVLKWNAVARALLKAPLEAALNDMPKHNRKRSESLKEQLEKQSQSVSELEQQIEG